MRIDVLIFGGGAAGLWLLDTLHRKGYRVLLAETTALGAGQTIAAQGIIHGGIKYTLTGLFTESARAIRDMPGVWRHCLSGQGQPDHGFSGGHRSINGDDIPIPGQTESFPSRGRPLSGP